ncbi:MAG: 2-C-methyl-D-erythritol 4-phosphate cytidylyltransferase [candidate division KSB1 bacterium]|nr:2-C-methyl-D-erythritol 4-phosphate cytidylyltransferase [candidate division KSB1 bacterium]
MALGRVVALIAAGGQGTRMGGKVNKQFLAIEGQPILAHTLRPFESCSAVDEIVIVAPKEWLFFVAHEIVDTFGFSKVRRVVEGGPERQHSVYAGLRALDPQTEIVVIHDAVRPFVDAQMIERVVGAARQSGAAIFAVRPRDTVKKGCGERVEATLRRDDLWLVQTPQAFRYTLILKAYENAFAKGLIGTDDAVLVEWLGEEVTILEGHYWNLKITTPEDLEVARLLLAARKSGAGKPEGS